MSVVFVGESSVEKVKIAATAEEMGLAAELAVVVVLFAEVTKLQKWYVHQVSSIVLWNRAGHVVLDFHKALMVKMLSSLLGVGVVPRAQW